MTPSKGMGTTVDDVTKGGAFLSPLKRGERISNTTTVKRLKRPYNNHSIILAVGWRNIKHTHSEESNPVIYFIVVDCGLEICHDEGTNKLERMTRMALRICQSRVLIRVKMPRQPILAIRWSRPSFQNSSSGWCTQQVLTPPWDKTHDTNLTFASNQASMTDSLQDLC